MTKTPIFEGSCVAIVTPFTEDGINFDKLGELIEFQIENGTDAILICGTTGEPSTMPDSEHKASIKFAVDKISKRVHVMAGTGSNDTMHGVELSKYAESVGADSVLSVTPYYNKTTQEGIYQHFKAYADAVTIPVVLYNVPSRTNLNIDPATLKRLSAIDNIVAVKECNLGQVAETRALCGDELVIYSGEDGNIVPLMSMGGKGVISVMANIIPADTNAIVKKFLNGDMNGSFELSMKTISLINALFCEVNPIPIKAAMNELGMDVGKVRLPLVDISEKGLETLKVAMKEYGLM